MERYIDHVGEKGEYATDGIQGSGDVRRLKGSKKRFIVTLLFLAVFLTIFLSGCNGKNSGKNGGEESIASSEMHIESIGGVYAFPVATGSDYQAPSGTDTVFLYAEREALEPGTGVFTLYDDADDSVLAEIPADSSQVTFGTVDEEQKVYYGIDGGTEIRISLGFGLEAGKRYYAVVSDDFARYGDVGSHAFGGKGQWPIQIEETENSDTENAKDTAD